MVVIKKLSPEVKEWLDSQNRKIQENLTKKIKKKKPERTKVHRCIIKAPNKLSLIDNTDETLAFLCAIIEETEKHIYAEEIYLDISGVSILTIDVVMYMLAVIKNIKARFFYKLKFSGNEPKDEDAKRLFNESGFYNHVNSYSRQFNANSKKIQIISGKEVSGPIVKQICDFVNSITNNDRGNTKILFKIIIELMTNTIQHAYTDKSINNRTVQQWYIFVEDDGDNFNFTFLDTGMGIPKTIRKDVIEKMGLIYNDAQFLLAALKGDWRRSETKQKNRGKGLPLIYENCINGYMKNLTILSCCGSCSVKNNDAELKVFKQGIFGTLFDWKISK